jgi:hypothetical protein
LNRLLERLRLWLTFLFGERNEAAILVLGISAVPAENQLHFRGIRSIYVGKKKDEKPHTFFIFKETNE